MSRWPADLLIGDSSRSLSWYLAVFTTFRQARASSSDRPSPSLPPSPGLSAGDSSFKCHFPAAVAALLCNAMFFRNVGLLQVEGQWGGDLAYLIGVPPNGLFTPLFCYHSTSLNNDMMKLKQYRRHPPPLVTAPSGSFWSDIISNQLTGFQKWHFMVVMVY